MDIKDIEAYKKEMMKLYSKGKNTEQEEKTPEIPENNTENENTTLDEEQEDAENEPTEEYDETDYADAEHDTSYYPYTQDDEDAELERIINYADLPDIEQLEQPEQLTETELGDSTGFILVNVRTGNESTPIVGASVVVTALENGKRLLAAAGITDISGTVTGIEVPAPDKIYSQTPYTDVRPYSLFDINVKARGFFNARSIDVPVFSGITSVQNFNMIPLPIGSDSNEETMTYFNG